MEEIQRAIAAGKKVMIYFSDLMPLPAGASIEQVKRLSAFREQLRTHRSCWTFQSRSRFRDDFANHLALVLNDFRSREKATYVANHPKPQFVRAPAERETFRSPVTETKFISTSVHLLSRQSWNGGLAAFALRKSIRLPSGSTSLPKAPRARREKRRSASGAGAF